MLVDAGAAMGLAGAFAGYRNPLSSPDTDCVEDMTAVSTTSAGTVGPLTELPLDGAVTTCTPAAAPDWYDIPGADTAIGAAPTVTR